MGYKEQIEHHLKNSGGIITSAYCREHKIPTVYLTRLVRQGVLTKVAEGIYLSEEGDHDELYFFQYRYKKTIFSYETALYLLGVTDKIVQSIDITVNNNYKFNTDNSRVNIYYVKEEILDVGVVEVRTIFGNPVKSYSYERTLCDFISNKEEMDAETYVTLIRSYSSYKERNIHSLYEIATKMGISKEVREIMEIAYE